jgi:hypothetical protein
MLPQDRNLSKTMNTEIDIQKLEARMTFGDHVPLLPFSLPSHAMTPLLLICPDISTIDLVFHELLDPLARSQTEVGI